MADASTLQKITQSTGHSLSPASAAWLAAALNPFSDYQQTLSGFPDVNTEPSVIHTYTTQMTIAAPASAGAGNWDCAVYLLPVDTTTGISMGQTIGPTQQYNHASLATNAVTWYPLTAVANTAGADCSLTSLTAAMTGLASRDAVGYVGRVIAKGFEVTNTTAEIYRQGTVSCVSSPPATQEYYPLNYIDTNASPWSPSSWAARVMGMLPDTPAKVRSIPGSSSWSAAQGAYMIGRLTSEPLPERETGRGIVYLSPAGYSYGTLPKTSIAYGALTLPVPHTAAHDAFSPAVAYFEGLSTQTTLVVNFRTFVEYFPDPGSALITECKASAAHDSFVLELYNEAARTAPYAVPVADNALGDLFRKVVSAVKSFAPVVATALTPFPAASMAVRAVGSLAHAIDTPRAAVTPAAAYPAYSQPSFQRQRPSNPKKKKKAPTRKPRRTIRY
jgi:hypothetical protein